MEPYSAFSKISRLHPLAAAIMSTCLLVGCEQTRETASVRGLVTIDGQPMDFGRVQFSPMATADPLDAGRSAVGFINADGTYQLSTYGKNDGAVIGTHRVIISSKTREEQSVQAEAAKDKYPDFDLLRVPDLRVDVQEGDNEINIPLSSESIRKYAEQD